MTSIGEKVAYVRSEGRKPAGHHTCHWPGCGRRVQPAMWGCRPHWYALPALLRQKIWKAYIPGQEIAKTPSPEYLAAAREVAEWIDKHSQPQGKLL